MRVIHFANGSEVSSRTVVLATGVSYRRLGISSAESLVGMGVYYGAALAEVPAMRGRRVFVVGAGNSAGQAAIYFARFAQRVTILVRGVALGETMSDYLVRQIIPSRGIHLENGSQLPRQPSTLAG
jgi:thioredoxin reductase (NADPH)